MIKGETVILIEKTVTGKNLIGEPIATSQEVQVDNVLIGTPSTDAAVQDLNLYGKRLAFVLGIPKGDNHNWKDTDVLIRGQKFRTYGFPLTQTEANVPGPWNTQVKVEAYE
ncbi:MAG: hypothetical protein IKP29_07630 [Pseudobutyrivibrio sp.]|nr:hypothetical protein [Pseudobutyrivibrio sp.]